MKNKIFTYLILISFFYPVYITAQASDGVKNENVIAVYIYNFTKFLEWPNNNSESLFISVLGKSNVTAPLLKIAEKGNTGGKKIIVDEIKDISQLKKNSILFITTDEENVLPAIVKKSIEKNVLTVSNAKGFASKGTCINFVLTDDKMKFEINLKSIEEAGIVPNSRLLSLAVKVYK